jgi:hypothetical protein
LIVGIVGFIGSGKGTVGDILVNEYGYQKMAFADPVKDATAAIFGWPRHLLEGDTEDSRAFREAVDPYWSQKFGYPVTPRWALQKVGTEAGRDVFHQNLWVDGLERRINSDKVIISDVRFPNEIQKIREIGGHIVRVVRGEEPEWYETARRRNAYVEAKGGCLHEYDVDEMEQKYPKIHISEWAWIGSSFDYVLYNNGSLAELRANVNYMMKVFSGPTNKVA